MWINLIDWGHGQVMARQARLTSPSRGTKVETPCWAVENPLHMLCSTEQDGQKECQPAYLAAVFRHDFTRLSYYLTKKQVVASCDTSLKLSSGADLTESCNISEFCSMCLSHAMQARCYTASIVRSGNKWLTYMTHIIDYTIGSAIPTCRLGRTIRLSNAIRRSVYGLVSLYRLLYF